MKQFAIVSVAYSQFIDKNRERFVSELGTIQREVSIKKKRWLFWDFYKKEVNYVATGGSAELVQFLNNGWTIHSIQTAPLTATATLTGAVIFQYILESP